MEKSTVRWKAAALQIRIPTRMWKCWKPSVATKQWRSFGKSVKQSVAIYNSPKHSIGITIQASFIYLCMRLTDLHSIFRRYTYSSINQSINQRRDICPWRIARNSWKSWNGRLEWAVLLWTVFWSYKVRMLLAPCKFCKRRGTTRPGKLASKECRLSAGRFDLLPSSRVSTVDDWRVYYEWFVVFKTVYSVQCKEWPNGWMAEWMVQSKCSDQWRVL